MVALFCMVILRCDSDFFKTKEVPVITDLSADLYEVDPGDTVCVTVVVDDQNDEALQYEWSANGGQFIPPMNQPQVLWKAPENGGNYKITVVVSNVDGESDPCSEVIYVRDKEPPEILFMEFEAYEVDPGDTIQISVTLKDMEDPTLEYHWTADGGQFLAPANQAVIRWKAPAVGGEYQITLAVSNNKKQSEPRSETVVVRSFAAPYVEITAPEEDGVFRQYDTIGITAIANHQNGIESVSLYLNETLVSTCNGRDEETYSFSCELTGPEGVSVLRVEAVANITGIIGSDERNIRVEGIILGK